MSETTGKEKMDLRETDPIRYGCNALRTSISKIMAYVDDGDFDVLVTKVMLEQALIIARDTMDVMAAKNEW